MVAKAIIASVTQNAQLYAHIRESRFSTFLKKELTSRMGLT
jgi:hypothetical protein